MSKNINKNDIVGKTFGRLTVLEYSHTVHKTKKSYVLYYKVQCNCENKTIKYVAKDHLTRMKIQSCGCIHSEILHNLNYTHGLTKSSEFKIWQCMKDRCYNPKNKHYKDYGGRGIKIYDGWFQDFKAFYDYIGQRPSKKYSMDRINNDGNYEPGNVRWATKQEQRRNQRALHSNTGYNGIHKLKCDKYNVTISSRESNLKIKIYRFDTLLEAIAARQQAEIKYWGGNCIY